ncbi:MAG: hypothetical protein KAS04_05880 [Candidatus Aenigmarchaeota archaeon]|nr:hypothetical protein [Candidatus Aenigmarchaeota archaeon]
MDGNIFSNIRNSTRLSILRDFEAVLGGVFIGLASFLMRAVLGGIPMDIMSLILMAFNPVAWLILVFGATGFFLFQKALHGGEVSVVMPIMMGFDIIIPILMAVFFLGETIGPIKDIGLILVIVGVFLLAKK